MLNNMKVLIGLLILITGLAYWVTQNQPGNTSQQPQALIPAWQQDDAQISAIDNIVLSQGGEQLVLTKMDDTWRLNNGFFAAIEPLFNLMQSLKAAEIIEVKTANPERHAQLDLADDDLKLSLSQAGEVKYAFHVGKLSTAGLRFVRLEGEDQTYTVKGLESIAFNADNWTLKTVLDVPAARVMAVTLKPENGESISVKRNPEDGVLQLADMPQGFQLKASAYLDQLAGGLARLMIDEAVPAESWPQTSHAVTEVPMLLTANYQLSSGEEITITVHQQGDDYFMTIDSDEYPQYADWVMKIAGYKFKALNRQLSEFIEPITMQDSVTGEGEIEKSGG